MLIAEYSYETDIAVQRAEALLEGEKKGKLEGKIETAKMLKQLGYPLQDIEKATGLSTQEIESL